jgi:hypothetical protein
MSACALPGPRNGRAWRCAVTARRHIGEIPARRLARPFLHLAATPASAETRPS